jgi:hypothetical protein
MRVRLFAKSRTLTPTPLPHAGEGLDPRQLTFDANRVFQRGPTAQHHPWDDFSPGFTRHNTGAYYAGVIRWIWRYRK